MLQKLLTEYLLTCNKQQQLAENIRQSLAANPYFQVVSVFERFDKFRKGYLEPADFSQFMLENQVYPTQPELYLIFRDFDKPRSGIVFLKDFEDQILPRQNRKLRKQAVERRPYPVQLKLQIDLQFLLGKYMQNKINGIIELTKLRQRMKTQNPNYSSQTFSMIDSRRSRYISTPSQLDTFLRLNGKCLTQQQLYRIFQVLNLNRQQQPIQFTYFQDHIDPFIAGCYPGYKQKMKEKETREYRYLQKKYEIENLRVRNIVDHQRLNYQIGELRDSNRRLRDIMGEQELADYYQGRKWGGYY